MLSISSTSKKLQAAVLLIFTIVFLLAPASCKKSNDDDPAPTVKEKVKGKWKVLTINTKYYENNELVDEENDDYSASQYTVEFTDTSVIITIPGLGSASYPIDYSTSKDTFEFHNDDGGLVKATVSFDNDKMTWIATEEYTEDGINYKDVTTIVSQKI
ncbi:hypothetical protein C3K47_14560 [Solitalea longa]|uniref:Lipocalin-like domain-containing protein n=1 Tax=Solitalea longa TaxID=2079460 RepID=A0A2S4ZZ29_9SPHI|nr:hypothetical protein [Solitalea longa]POY35615.1 hypothetical protein C3K47_14560 [Solitalea longa]